MKLVLKAKVFKATNLNEAQIERQPFTVGRVNFDNRNGLGAVSDCANVVYMGVVTMMHPANFLRLAAEGISQDQLARLRPEMLKGTPVGSPFLALDDKDGYLRVTGHEGRHRCVVIEELQDEPIPVCIFIRGLRARHWTPELIAELNSGVQKEKSSTIVTGAFEGIWVDHRWISQAEMG